MTSFAGIFEDHLGMDAVVAYVDGELSLVAYQRVAAHLQRCPMCAAEVADQSFARESLRAAVAPRMPTSLLANLCSIPVAMPAPADPQGAGRHPVSGSAIRIHTVPRDVARSRRFRFGAGALVAGIAVGALVSVSPADSEMNTTPPAQPAVHRPVGPAIVVTPASVTPNR